MLECHKNDYKIFITLTNNEIETGPSFVNGTKNVLFEVYGEKDARCFEKRLSHERST